MFKIDFESIDSTSAYLKREHLNLASFTFVSSLHQSRGKGRFDRVWHSKNGENLLFSVLLKEPNLAEIFKKISIVSAVAICRVIESFGIKNAAIKWPNDVYCGDQKIAGILLEGSLPDYLVVGIGINLNQKDFLEEYRTSPTSLCLELGRDISLDEFKKAVYESLQEELRKAIAGDDSFFSYFDSHDYLLEKNVSVSGSKQGIARGIDKDCSLILDCCGKKVALSSGEIE